MILLGLLVIDNGCTCYSYYTGISPQLLPSQCRYTHTTYNPTRTGFLLSDRRKTGFTGFFQERLNQASAELKLTVDLRPVESAYPKHEWHHLTLHRGIVALPLQPSMMAIFERYSMNIPMFFPSKVR